MSIGVDPRSHREVAAAVGALRAATREVRKISRDDTVREFRPVWAAEVRQRAHGGPGGRQREALLRAGVGFSGGNPPEGWAYRSRRRLSGGLSADPWQPYEFGATRARRESFTEYRARSPKGTPHRVKRRTARQLPPYFRAEGYSVYPTLAALAPRVVSFWVASVVRAYNVAFEGVGR